MKKTLLILLLVISCNKDGVQDSNLGSPETTTPGVEQGNSTTPTNPINPTANWTEDFMTLINNHRRELGLRSLIHDDDLAKIALGHSQNMASGFIPMGHIGFSSRCEDARDALGGGNLCSENVAAGQKTPQAAFTAWMNSPGHRANIEQPRVSHTGFAFAKSSSGKYYWTQIFIEH